MNPRIRELADQILPNEREWHRGDPDIWGYFFSGDELEKFAGLIVRECGDRVAKMVVREKFDRIPQDPYNQGWNAAVAYAGRELQQYFGVE